MIHQSRADEKGGENEVRERERGHCPEPGSCAPACSGVDSGTLSRRLKKRWRVEERGGQNG